MYRQVLIKVTLYVTRAGWEHLSLGTRREHDLFSVNAMLRGFLFILLCMVTVKVKLSLCSTKHHAMKTY